MRVTRVNNAARSRGPLRTDVREPAREAGTTEQDLVEEALAEWGRASTGRFDAATQARVANHIRASVGRALDSLGSLDGGNAESANSSLLRGSGAAAADALRPMNIYQVLAVPLGLLAEMMRRASGTPAERAQATEGLRQTRAVLRGIMDGLEGERAGRGVTTTPQMLLQGLQQHLRSDVETAVEQARLSLDDARRCTRLLANPETTARSGTGLRYRRMLRDLAESGYRQAADVTRHVPRELRGTRACTRDLTLCARGEFGSLAAKHTRINLLHGHGQRAADMSEAAHHVLNAVAAAVTLPDAEHERSQE